jgi:hypothetical protein
MDKPKVTAERLRQLFDYNPATGDFVAKTSRGGHFAGRVAGARKEQRCGHIYICIDRRLYLAHRLAFLWMTGEWPKLEVDHINCNGSDNRWVNLRDVPGAVNLQNQIRPRKCNRSGFQGVSPNRKRWAAQIKACGAHIHLGTFDTPELAHAAYVEAKRRLHVGCTL